MAVSPASLKKSKDSAYPDLEKAMQAEQIIDILLKSNPESLSDNFLCLSIEDNYFACLDEATKEEICSRYKLIGWKIAQFHVRMERDAGKLTAGKIPPRQEHAKWRFLLSEEHIVLGEWNRQ
jgi:hypothetical protein